MHVKIYKKKRLNGNYTGKGKIPGEKYTHNKI